MTIEIIRKKEIINIENVERLDSLCIAVGIKNGVIRESSLVVPQKIKQNYYVTKYFY